MKRDSPERVPWQLQKLARSYSIQISYRDAFGVMRSASRKSLLAMLRTRGVADSSLEEELAAIASSPYRSGYRTRTEHTYLPVEEIDGTRGVHHPVPESASGLPFHARLQFENGEVRQWDGRVETFTGDPWTSLSFDLGREVPIGYHELEILFGSERHVGHVISAPEKVASPYEKQRVCGLFAPLYSNHGRESIGSGSYGDFERLATWAGARGCGLLGTLPLLATFLDELFDPSPYQPVSRLFWSEVFLDLDRADEIRESEEARQIFESEEWTGSVAELRGNELVDYRRQMSLMRKVLEIGARRFFESGAHEPMLAVLREEEPEIDRYAQFRAVSERHRSPWWQWPARMRDGTIEDGDFDSASYRYHLYVQWLASRQIAALADHARSAGTPLFLDYPLGTNRAGFDCWRWRRLFVETTSVGAPPDISYRQGQDWGFSPLDPDQLDADGYQYFARAVRKQLRHAGALRIDHAMSLRRLYWIPAGLTPSEGAYVGYNSEKFYAVLAIESTRARAQIVGEDLGTVSAEMRGDMLRHGLRRLFVLQRQLTHVADDPPGPIIPRMLASANNHDMAPFAAFWHGSDLVEKLRLGVIDGGHALAEQAKRTRARSILLRILRDDGLIDRSNPELAELVPAMYRWLSRGKAELVLVNLEDLWLECESQNIPTTTTQRPNWRRKFRMRLDEIERSQGVGSQIEAICSERLRPRARNVRRTRPR